ncbi:5616_t:CDS:1, partial [Cetraspora pellucida]
ISRARKFPDDFYAENNLLMCHFCNYSINFNNVTFIKSHHDSEAHQRAKRNYLSLQRTDKQQSIESLIQVNE